MKKIMREVNKFRVVVEATMTFYKEIDVLAYSKSEAKRDAKSILLDEDPTRYEGWYSEEPARMTAEDCEEI